MTYNNRIMNVLFNHRIYNNSHDYTYMTRRQSRVCYLIIQALHELSRDNCVKCDADIYGYHKNITKGDLLKVIKFRYGKFISDKKPKTYNNTNNIDSMCFNSIFAMMRPMYLYSKHIHNSRLVDKRKRNVFHVRIAPQGKLLYKAWQEKIAGTLKNDKLPRSNKQYPSA